MIDIACFMLLLSETNYDYEAVQLVFTKEPRPSTLDPIRIHQHLILSYYSAQRH